jgi:hypothetical protein
MQERPSHADSLDEILATALRLFSRGVADRRSAFRAPTLATVNAAGHPCLRTVVLRGFEPAARGVTIHTDRRASKMREIQTNPSVALHVYDQSACIQLRIDAIAEIHVDDAVAQKAWARTPPMSRLVYSVQTPPGTPVPAPPNAPDNPDVAAANFAVLSLTFYRIEWLWLNHAGHRRAAFTWNAAGECHATWLVP